MEKILENIKVAGTFYHLQESDFDFLYVGGTLQVIAEFENKFDGNAISLYYNTTKIGYIPKELNQNLAYLLRSGKSLKATIVAIDNSSFNVYIDIFNVV
jgi:hypothetical protein